MAEYCKTERDGRTLIVTIARPEVMNSLHPMANAELNRVWDDFQADDTLLVGIITGEGGRAFCAGNDLKYAAAGGEFSMPAGGFGGLTSRLDCDKPILAAVNGLAYGGGFEIALACDLIIAADTARFALPEPRVGLAALAGGPQRLTQKIPHNQAMALLLTGKSLTAIEGQALGLVNEVVPTERVLEAAKAWARDIQQCAPLSIQVTKHIAAHSVRCPDIRASLDYTQYPLVTRMAESPDFIEGPLAFSEKRPPRWLG